MEYKQIKVDSVLKKITKKDVLFNGDYIVDPYQNCEFGCLYCDSSFDTTIYVKVNSDEIIEDELRKQEKGRVIIGSVHDPYQKIEKDYKITRKILKNILDLDFSCHILTKSDLVLRDLDLLSEINDCIVTMSIISTNDNTVNTFEKNVPSTQKRFEVMKKLNNNNIKSGLAIMPVLPYIVEDELENIVSQAKDYDAQYLLHKHLELKGDQKTIFLNLLNKHYYKSVNEYEKLYKDSYMPNENYISTLDEKMYNLCNKYKLKNIINIG